MEPLSTLDGENEMLQTVEISPIFRTQTAESRTLSPQILSRPPLEVVTSSSKPVVINYQVSMKSSSVSLRDQEGSLSGETVTQPSSTPPSTATAPPKGQDPDHKIVDIMERLPLSHSLGLWACIVILGGTILTLTVLGFLIFLWAGEGPKGGESATYLWRKIMLSESSSTQTITICSVVIRTIAAAQAVICTSLTAALLLERRRLPLSRAVQVSVARGVNDGPFNFVREVISWRALRETLRLETCLLIIVTAATFGTQFTSTILVSGFNRTTLVQFPEQLHHNVILSVEAAQNVSKINSFSQFPPSYAIFGEVETDQAPDPGPNGVSDTGAKSRSFLPFQEEQRTKLRKYEGPAFSETTQVMCMRPFIEAQVFSDHVMTARSALALPFIEGTISYDKTFKEAGLETWTMCTESNGKTGHTGSLNLCLPQNISCTFPLMEEGDSSDLPSIGLCHLGADVIDNTSDNERENYSIESYWNDSNPLWSANAYPWIYLTLGTNLTSDAWIQDGPRDSNSSIALGSPVAQVSEWYSYQILPNMILNLTLCFAGVATGIYDVSMATTVNPMEPEVKWTPAGSEDGAESGQNFMGTTIPQLSAAERGVMSISAVRDPTGLALEDLNISSHTLWFGPYWFTGMATESTGGSWVMCNFCQFEGWAIPPGIAALFARTIHTTGRAAWAIQTFLTIYTESWYAQILPQFDVASDIRVTSTTDVRVPKSWAALVAVLVMTVVNLVCVWTITVLYAVHSRYSCQGNVWHTISQLMSDHTKPILEQSNQMKDSEVAKRVEKDDYLVFIGRSKGSDKVTVLKA
ncbi:hypothetical protein N8I77_007596 [Diaporthe amygdali]|uniref:Uncharacterized protein n=1 Tax=Phomopsis amygdali TaxID=1214568 RepID=A0AAD9W3K9_PHOAM|nr:hypothetical protein N8I77_007596 [Diaporthe amygdali]